METDKKVLDRIANRDSTQHSPTSMCGPMKLGDSFALSHFFNHILTDTYPMQSSMSDSPVE